MLLLIVDILAYVSSCHLSAYQKASGMSPNYFLTVLLYPMTFSFSAKLSLKSFTETIFLASEYPGILSIFVISSVLSLHGAQQIFGDNETRIKT